jgi:hypothetical protein
LRIAAFVAALTAIVCAAPVTRGAVIVAPGFDLLQTVPGTQILGAPFVGVPLGTFDFGGAVGVQPVGSTDTIIKRLDPVDDTGGSPATVNFELVAMHLQSAVPVDFGLGLGIYYLTLQSERGGPTSVGQMAIHFSPDPQTFDSFFDVFFDIRLGAINGPIALSDERTFETSGTPWSHLPPPGAVLVDGANHLLDGSTSDQDFFATGQIAPSAVETFNLILQTAGVIPAPTTVALLGAGLVLLGMLRRRA